MRHTVLDGDGFELLRFKLGLPKYVAIGIVESIIQFAIARARDGVLDGKLDAMFVWTGYAGDGEELVEILLTAGVLTRESGQLAISRWNEEMPNWLRAIKKRWAGRGEVAEKPKRRSKASPAKEATAEPKQAEHVPVAIEPKPEASEPKPEVPVPVLVVLPAHAEDFPLPKNLDNLEFSQLWRSWATKRFMGGKPIGPEEARAVLTELELHGRAVAIRSLKRAIKRRSNTLEIVDPKPEAPARAAFSPPTVAEVESYCKHQGFVLDAERFVAHYEASGWKLKAGVPVTSWRACVTTWVKRQADFEKRDALAKNGPESVRPLRELTQRRPSPRGTPLMMTESQKDIVADIGRTRA